MGFSLDIIQRGVARIEFAFAWISRTAGEDRRHDPVSLQFGLKVIAQGSLIWSC
jgi:hypothetical protein